VLVEQIGRDDVQPVEQVADALVGIVGRPSHHSHDFVPLLEQQLGQVRAVLAGDPRNQRRASGLPRLGALGRFSPLFPPPGAARGGTGRGGISPPALGTHSRSDRLWLESVTSVAKAPSRGTTSATPTTRPIAAGTPTCSECGPSSLGRCGGSVSARAA